MRRLVVPFIVLVCAVPAIAEDAVEAEQKKLAGTWKAKEGSADGLSLPTESLVLARIVFDGNKFTFKEKDGANEKATTYKVDPEKGTIEIIPPKGETKTMRGRYRFDGATLRIVFTEGDKFPEKVEGGKDLLMLVLEKEKEKGK
ncbi:MAG TPA: TIGR03067 domain-containing protein [Gemmataceae bacterium]|jgi:uncharacterized protein (TIGR03067 family)|nr:TIGR03067 domain-containing protein [Gemmataceae bacterium]